MMFGPILDYFESAKDHFDFGSRKCNNLPSSTEMSHLATVKLQEVTEVQPGSAVQSSKLDSISKEIPTQQGLVLDSTQWEREVDDLYVTNSDSSDTPEEMDIPCPQDQQDREHIQSKGQDIPTDHTGKKKTKHKSKTIHRVVCV